MKNAIGNFAFWCLFAFVCAMWLSSTACEDGNPLCLVSDEIHSKPAGDAGDGNREPRTPGVRMASENQS